MAANFWTSNHCKEWLVDEKTVSGSNAGDLKEKDGFTTSEIWRLRLYFVEYIHKIGKGCSLRQHVISTAIVFFKRFYLKTCFTEFDPRLVGPTMLFLAAKVEECSVPNFVKNLKGVDPAWPYTMDSMLECEFYALHYLNFDLIVFHPYRPLTQYLADGKAPDTLQTAWSIVNDSYRTDLSLMYAPYLIAIAAIYMACNFLSKDYNAWLEKSLNVKLEDSHHRQIVAITKKMLRLYDDYSKMKSMDPPIELMRRLDDIFKRKKGSRSRSLGRELETS